MANQTRENLYETFVGESKAYFRLLAYAEKAEEEDLGRIALLFRAVAEADFFDGKWIPEKFHTLHYLTGNKYGLMTQMVEARHAK